MDSGTELKLPKMKMIRQRFDIPPAVDVLAEVDREWMGIKDHLDLPQGSSVAMAVGSRGISNLSVVVQAVATLLKEAGYDPFVTPAMGSHGGATAEGQTEVLAARGITEESVGVPVRATADITFTQYVDTNDYPAQNPTSGGGPIERIRTIGFNFNPFWITFFY